VVLGGGAVNAMQNDIVYNAQEVMSPTSFYQVAEMPNIMLVVNKANKVKLHCQI